MRWVSGSRQGGAKGVHLVNPDCDFAMYGEGSTQKKWHLPIQHLCRKRVQFMENSGCPSSPCYHHNSVSPCMSLVPSKQLSLHQSPECLKEERLYVGTLGGCLSFRRPLSHLNKWNHHWFSQLDVLGVFFMAPVFWAGDPRVVLGILDPQRKPVATELSLQCVGGQPH